MRMMQPQAHRSIESLCRMASVSRAGFYRHWQEHEPRVEETAVRDQVQKIALAHRGNYGYRRVTWELRQQGWSVNHKPVARIMREDNLLCVRRRRFLLTTDSRHNLEVYVNLAARLELSGIDQLWVADLTYIRLREEFVYLAVVLDAFSPAGGGLGAGPIAACAFGHRSVATSFTAAAAGSGPGASLRSRNPICVPRVRQRPGGARHRSQHESPWQSLRQWQVRKLYQNSQAGGNLYSRVSRPGRSGNSRRPLSGAVLQSPTLTLGVELPLPSAVRAKLPAAPGSLARSKHEFF
jgi:hypothetical protein